MSTAYTVVAAITAAASAFSGIAALLHFRPIFAGMRRAGVPVSWLRFPIGTLKVAGAAGLAAGLLGVPWIGTAAAAGLVLYFVAAVQTHLLAADHSAQFFLALGFLTLAATTLGLGLAA